MADADTFISESPVQTVDGGDVPDFLDEVIESTEAVDEAVSATEEKAEAQAAEVDDVAAALAAFQPPDFSATAEEDPEEDEGDPATRADRRIQKLNDRTKAAEAELASAQRWIQNAQGQNQQLRQAYTQVLNQNHDLEVRFAKLEGQMSAAPPAAQQPAASKWGAEAEQFGSEIEQRLLARVGPHIQKLEKENQALVQRLAQRDQQAERAQRNAQVTNAVTQATRRRVLDGFDPQDGARRVGGGPLNEWLDSLVMAVGYGSNKNPEESALILRSVLDAYAYGRQRAHFARSKVGASTKQPQAAPKGGAGASQNKKHIPSYKEARAGGHSDELSALMAKDGLEPN